MHDEPTAGLNHTEANRLSVLPRDFRENGLAIVLLDHNLRMMMALSAVPNRTFIVRQDRMAVSL